MGRYGITHQTAAGTDLCLVNLTGSASIRPMVYDMIIGSDATPADVATEFNFDRTTDVGTGGSPLTEVALDPLTVGASAAGLGGTFTTDPTDGNALMMIALNQRATFRWVAAPGGELIATASANNGVGLYSVASGGTPNINVSLYWQE